MAGSFEMWMQRVNHYIRSGCGLTSEDLPDRPYRDWYEDAVPATVAAKRAIKYAKEN